MMTVNPNFTGEDYEFVAGHIMGLRAWQVDAEGRLVGVTFPAIWKPGENVSKCYQDRRAGVCPMSFEQGHIKDPCEYGNCDTVYHYRDEHNYERDCSCGFWAYNEHSFSADGAIVGVVKGWGKTTVGPKGFRCEKAEIMALSRAGASRSLWRRLQELYPDVEFYEERDDMVEDFPEVCKQYGEVGEDFWEQTKQIVNVRAPNGMTFASGGHLTLGNIQLSVDPSQSSRNQISGTLQSGKATTFSLPPPVPPEGVREPEKKPRRFKLW